MMVFEPRGMGKSQLFFSVYAQKTQTPKKWVCVCVCAVFVGVV